MGRETVTLLTGSWEGWEKHGGGARYWIIGPGDREKRIGLYYDIAGSAIGLARNSASSSRPWSAQIGREMLRGPSGRVRYFGPKESARRAAELHTK